MTGELFITDGTTYINLLTGVDGFVIHGWTPTIPPTKQTWRDSPLSDGRKLAMSKWANATETFSLSVTRFTQDDAIQDMQELRRLLLAAREYFIGGTDTPVYIQARGDCETNTRYAVICDWRAETDDDPYHKPFSLDHPVMDGLTLVLERQHWLHMPPGTSECVELSATQAYYDEQTGAFVPLESADDCRADSTAGTINLNADSIRFGNLGGNSWHAGVRFRTVSIPQGADIVYAWVEFEADVGGAGDNCNVIVYADDADNSAVFSTYADFAGRTRTTAHTHWDTIAHWVGGTHYQTPDIAAVVQEVVDRAGWASGNSLAVLIDNNASSADAYRTPVSWDHAAARYEPHLYVWWFDSTTRTFGRTATCNNEVYVANKHNRAQLTHIFVDDGGVFGANLIGAALPFNLLPAVPAANDAVYFGIATAAADSGPFNSIVFDIGTAIANVTTIVWSQWTGAAWTAVTVRDNTNADGASTGVAFDTTGVNVLVFQPINTWVPTVVNGVTAYWVRALVTVIGAGPTAPTQQNRDVYTVVTPYIDTVASEVAGDIQALAKMKLEGQSGDVTLSLEQMQAFLGLKSYDDHPNFSAFINLADEQNQPGIVVTVNGGSTVFGSYIQTASGRVADWTTGGAAAESELAYVTIPTALIDDYAGEYRCFLRYALHAMGTPLMRLKIAVGDTLNRVFQTDQKGPVGAPTYGLIDFGKITLPPMPYDTGETYKSLYLQIHGQATAATGVYLMDLILIPTDECFIDTSDASTNGISLGYIAGEWKRLNVDSTIPRRMVKTTVENITGYKISSWTHRANGPLVFQPNEHQRWWILQTLSASSTDSPVAQTLSAQAWQVSRYLSMRGGR